MYQKYDQRLRENIVKLYRKFGKMAPDIYQNYSRTQMQKVLFVMKEQINSPVGSHDEMFEVIEHLPPQLQRGKTKGNKYPLTSVGNIKSVSQAREITMGLSIPSKMPCFSYNLPAKFCITGSKLAENEKTICHNCFALKGWYKMKWVQDVMEKRLKSIIHPDWEDAIIFDIIRYRQSHFRWHDSGDLQSLGHLTKIVNIANRLPNVKFWLATKELNIVVDGWKKIAGKTPLDKLIPNLTIRISSTFFDEKPPVKIAKKIGIKTSMVSVDCPTCPAHEQGNKCLDCRTCWDQKSFCVVYQKH